MKYLLIAVMALGLFGCKTEDKAVAETVAETVAERVEKVENKQVPVFYRTVVRKDREKDIELIAPGLSTASAGSVWMLQLAGKEETNVKVGEEEIPVVAYGFNLINVQVEPVKTPVEGVN